MASLSIFRPDSRIVAPDAPDILLDRIAFRVVKEFLQRTEVWSEPLASPLDFSVGVTKWSPPAPTSGSAVARVESIRWRPTGENILPLTKQQLEESFPGWETEADEAPEYYVHDSPSTVRFYPLAADTVSDAIEMTVILTLAANATTFPDWLYDKYSEALINGIYARLYALPNRPWTDLGLAQQYNAAFEATITSGMNDGTADFAKPAREVAYGGI